MDMVTDSDITEIRNYACPGNWIHPLAIVHDGWPLRLFRRSGLFVGHVTDSRCMYGEGLVRTDGFNAICVTTVAINHQQRRSIIIVLLPASHAWSIYIHRSDLSRKSRLNRDVSHSALSFTWFIEMAEFYLVYSSLCAAWHQANTVQCRLSAAWT